MTGPRSLLDIIGERGTALGRLARRAEESSRLARRIAALLGDRIGEHVVSASLRGDTVTVITDSPVWAARVRFESGSVLAGLREAGLAGARALTVKVRAPTE